MFENYLQYSNIPAGAILDRIRQKRSLTQRGLAKLAGLSPQSLNNYIHNWRSISPQVSCKLNNALSLGRDDYFTIAQQNHKNFKSRATSAKTPTPDLNKLRPAIFWDTHFDKIDWQGNMQWVVFEYGNDEEIAEIIRFYGKQQTSRIISGIKSRWKSETRTNNLRHWNVSSSAPKSCNKNS